MTRHLNTPKNITLVNGSYPTHEPPEWESRMAKLVGLENEAISEEVEENTVFWESPSSQPQEAQTQQTFSSNPFMKLGLVGATTLVIFVLAGGFLWQIMNIGQQTPKKNNEVTINPQQKTESRLQTLETEVENLKTKLAFTEQEQAIKLAQQTLRKKENKPASPTPPRSSVTPPQNITAPQVKTVYVPQIVTVEKIVRVPQPVPQSTPKPPATPKPASTPAPQNNVTQAVNIPATPPQNRVPQPVNPPTPPPQNRVPQPVNPPVATPPVQQPPIPSQTASIPTATPVSQPSPQRPKTIPVGTSAKAVLTTAVFGETSKPNNSDEDANVFVVTLVEPLKTPDGEVALPANAQLLTKISSLTDKGLLYLSVDKVIWENNGNLVEKSLPRGSIGIRSGKGKPLFAEAYPNHSGSVTTMDMGLFVLGGLGKVAQLFNRTESEVVTTTVGGTIVTSNNNSPNFTAGVVEGGLNAVIPQITQRNQQAMAEMLQRTNIWFLSAGTDVEIYINQPIQF